MAGERAELLRWTNRLTGLDESRVTSALATLETWKLPLVTEEFVRRLDLDAVVGATLLKESVDVLVAQGVAESKLMKKLRDPREINELWAAWAEIRGAAILIGHPDAEFAVQMEAPASGAKRPDFLWTLPDGTRLWLEFKAVGLSDAELDWHRRAAERFDWLLPPKGLFTLHASLENRIWITSDKRSRAWTESRITARDLGRQVPGTGWDQVRGVAVVGHQTEAKYLQRARGAIQRAAAQLPASQESWVALWWGNGAPTQSAAGLLDSVGAPPNITGLVFVGQSLAVPWSTISVFIVPVPRGEDIRDMEMVSSVDNELATRVLERHESSAGVRPTLLKAPNGMDLIRRDDKRRLAPFNLLFDADPRKLAGPHRPPSPVQDTVLNQ